MSFPHTQTEYVSSILLGPKMHLKKKKLKHVFKCIENIRITYVQNRISSAINLSYHILAISWHHIHNITFLSDISHQRTLTQF